MNDRQGDEQATPEELSLPSVSAERLDVPPSAPPSSQSSVSERIAPAAQLGRGSLRQRAVRASAWVVMGMLATQALRFASNIILAQLLLPAHFGIMLIVNVVLQGMRMFSDVGIRGSIVSSQAGDLERFLNTAWTIQVIRGVGLWLLICLLAWPVARFYEEPILTQVLPVIGLIMIFYGLSSTATLTLTRHVQFGRQVGVQLVGQTLGIVIMVAWAWLWPSVWAFVAGGIFQVAFQCVASYRLIPGYRNRFMWDADAAKQIFHFGKWIFVCTALQFFLMSGDKAVLGKVFTTSEVGVFAIAVLLCESLLQILRRLSHEVLLPVYARLSETGDRRHFRVKTMQMRSVLLAISLPPLWLLAVFGQPIVTLLYPERYAGAGPMLQWLAIGAVGTVVSMTAERVTLARGDSFRATVVQAVRSVLLIGAMLAGFKLAGPIGVLVGAAVAHIVDYPVTVWSIHRYDAWLPWLDLSAYLISAIVIATGIIIFNQSPF